MFNYNILALVSKIAKTYPDKAVSMQSIKEYIINDLRINIPKDNLLSSEYSKIKDQFHLISVGEMANKLLSLQNNKSLKLPKDFTNDLDNLKDSKELIDLDKFGNMTKSPNKDGGISVQFTIDSLIKNGLPNPVTYKELNYRVQDFLDYVVTSDQPNVDKYIDKANNKLDGLISIISEIAIQVPDKKASRSSIIKLIKEGHRNNPTQDGLLLCSILLDAHMMAARDFNLLNSGKKEYIAFAKKHPEQDKKLEEMEKADLILDLKDYEHLVGDKVQFNYNDFVKLPNSVTYSELLDGLRKTQIK
ncbi:hypothetical protein MOO46_05945 [Apilactobacillus apisilvae]|uniref:Uncharacterized protein n=1 Tax=Apilactobacillus apisilvae TaxID=2923364 RepID=A0ABY4PG55_9LACO|nr:hypothetical protein [Apilactobacillus apisilvae]UQS84785.1 hypothetical protein MOO46_05945 [Apilactobacillus apisilvae]